MTKKQYKRRVMETFRTFKMKYVPDEKMITDRIGTPKWGVRYSRRSTQGRSIKKLSTGMGYHKCSNKRIAETVSNDRPPGMTARC